MTDTSSSVPSGGRMNNMSENGETGEVTLPRSVVQAVFDVAHGSLDHGSGMLDSEDIAALLTVAQALLPDDHVTVLDLVAEQREMATAMPEPHTFRPDRSGKWQGNPMCLECGRPELIRSIIGRQWHQPASALR